MIISPSKIACEINTFAVIIDISAIICENGTRVRLQEIVTERVYTIDTFLICNVLNVEQKLELVTVCIYVLLSPDRFCSPLVLGVGKKECYQDYTQNMWCKNIHKKSYSSFNDRRVMTKDISFWKKILYNINLQLDTHIVAQINPSMPVSFSVLRKPVGGDNPPLGHEKSYFRKRSTSIIKIYHLLHHKEWR